MGRAGDAAKAASGLGSSLLLALLLLPRPADAALTLPVEGLEAAANSAWSADPKCAALKMDDLVARNGALVLATTTFASFTFSRDDSGHDACAFQGWHVAVEGIDPHDGCVHALCGSLGGLPNLEQALETALKRSGPQDEIHVPLHWSPPKPTALGLIWFSCCLLTLVLLAALLVLRKIRGVPPIPSGLTRPDWIVVAAIATAGLILRAWLARHMGLENDESVSQGYDSLWREFDGRETVMNPPLYRVISFPVSAWTRGSPEAGRIVPVLLGVPLILFVARFAAMLGGRTAGVLAAVMAASHPCLVLATVYHRGYAPLVAATALSLLAAQIALRSGRDVDRYFLAACLGAVFLSHYIGAAIVAGVALWIFAGDRPRWREWTGPASLLLVLCLPFVPAAISGEHAKEHSGIGILGLQHAASIFITSPGVVVGLLPVRLETPVGLLKPWLPAPVAFGIFIAAMLLALRRLPGTERVGLATTLALATFFPALLAVRATTIREFHSIAACVPAVVLGGVALAAVWNRWRSVAIGATAALVACFVLILPPTASNLRRDVDAAVDLIQSDPAHWPVFVWGQPEPGFTQVALEMGVSRIVADLSTDGTDARIRPLRSCSTAAVREASRQRPGHAVRVELLGDSCLKTSLEGRGVSCEAGRKLEGVALLDCRVDPVSVSSVSLPSPLPENIARRVDRAIPPGHEKLFTDAVLPRVLSQPDANGVKLWGVRIAMEYVQYELKPSVGASATVTASPRFSDDSIAGTEFTVSPEESSLPPELRRSVQQLRASFESRVTPGVWNDTYGLVTNGAGGHTPIPFRGWLVLWGVAILVLAFELAKARRTTLTNR